MNDMNPKANQQPAFAKFLGIKITHLSADKVTAELAMRADLNNRFDIMHGGAVMALADNLGGTAALVIAMGENELGTSGKQRLHQF